MVYNNVMKLRIYNTNKRYAFTVDGFSSLHHANLIPDIEPTYEYAWQAYRKAKDFAFDKGFHVEAMRNKKYAIEDLSKPIRSDIDAEELLLDHYRTMVNEISDKVVGIDDNAQEEKEMTYLIIKSQVGDLLRIKENVEGEEHKVEVDKLIDSYRKIVQQHFKAYLRKDKEQSDAARDAAPEVPNMPPMEEGQPPPQDPNLTMASKKTLTLTREELFELLEHYGQRACQAISKHHPDAICKVSLDDLEMQILALDSGKQILRISINDKFNVNNVMPSDGLADSFPSFSSKFYQRYWKPVVESIGHFFLDDLDALIVPEMGALPDMREGEDCQIKGWNPRELKEMPLSMSFGKETPTWMVSKSEPRLKKIATEYTEEDFLLTQPTRVRCIDQKLQLLGSIGEVVKIIPINAGIGFELDVNFGRKIVRLSKNQVEIVNDL